MAWDSTMKVLERKTNKQMAHIVYTRFMSGDTKDATKYSIGGLYVRSYVKRVSRKALENIKKQNPEREHTIPIEETYRYFRGMFDAGCLSEEKILGFMPKLFLALITEKENRKQSAAHLSRKMPDGWWDSEELDPLKRYRDAGLGDDIWAKF